MTQTKMQQHRDQSTKMDEKNSNTDEEAGEMEESSARKTKLNAGNYQNGSIS